VTHYLKLFLYYVRRLSLLTLPRFGNLLFRCTGYEYIFCCAPRQNYSEVMDPADSNSTEGSKTVGFL
jgi:hypothetical protein